MSKGWNESFFYVTSMSKGGKIELHSMPDKTGLVLNFYNEYDKNVYVLELYNDQVKGLMEALRLYSSKAIINMRSPVNFGEGEYGNSLYAEGSK